MLRLSGLAVLFLLLTGAGTPAFAIGGGGGGGSTPFPNPCSTFGLSTGGAALADASPAKVLALGSPGASEYYIASGYGVYVCAATNTLYDSIIFASNGYVGMSYNNINNSGSQSGGYFTPVAPAAELDVSGINSTLGASDYYIDTTPGGVRIGYDSASCSSTNAGEMIYTGSNSPSGNLQYCNGSAWVYFSSNGNGKLGTTSPGVLVELTAGSAAAPSLTFYADTTTGIYQNPVDTMEITTNGTQSATFDASGNFSLKRGAYEINSITILGAPAVDQTGSLALGSGVLSAIFLSGTHNTGIGYQASTSLLTGSSDTAMGYEAMQYNWNSNDSTAIGYQAMEGISATVITGNNNTAIGAQSLAALTTGANNTAVGYQALQKTTTGSYNTGAGSLALTSNVTGSDSTAAGYETLNVSTAGPNTAAGYEALLAATSGTGNTAIGYQALDSVTTGSSNTAIGSIALSGTTGSGNTGAGYSSFGTGSYNVSIGADSGDGGSYNTVVGMSAFTAGTGSYNVAVGAFALEENTSGNYNIAIGRSSQHYTGTGSSNIAFGAVTMEGSSTTPLGGSNNISLSTSQASMQSTATGNIAAIINATAALTTGSWNIALGQGSLLDLTTGSYNTAIGEHALETITTSSDNTAIGNTSLAGASPGPNTAIGYFAGELPTGTNNTAMGWEALKGAGTSTGSYNTAIGDQALLDVTAANHNTGAGYLAGGATTFAASSDNTLFGWEAGHLIASGNSNIIVGEVGNITSGASNILVGNSLAGTTAATSYQLDIGDLIEGLTSSATSPNVAFEKALADASLSVQTPLTGFSITVGNGTGTLILTPAGTLASGTITMPSAPVKGQILRLASTATVTSLTLSANTGQSISNAISTITGATPVAYVYLASTTTWYRIQ